MIYSILYTIPYILIFLILFIFSIPVFTEYKDNVLLIKQTKNYFVVILMLLFIAFRGFVLGDCLNYYDVYQIVPKFSLKYNVLDLFYNNNNSFEMMEPGFILLISIFKVFTKNYLVFQSINSIIELLILYFFFKKYNNGNIILGFTFFILFFGINLSFMFERNIKSIILFIVSLQYLIRNKILPYILLNVLGAMFHVSSFFYLPLYYFANRQINKKIILILFFIGNIIFLFHIQWFKQFLSLITHFLPKRLEYLTSMYLENKGTLGGYGFTIGYFERFFTFILVFYFSNKLYFSNKKLSVFINSFYIYIIIFLFCSEFTIVVERVPILFVFSYWILYPNVYFILNNDSKIIFLFILLFYGLIKLLAAYDQIPASYDNLLFGYKTYTERRQELNYFHQVRGF